MLTNLPCAPARAQEATTAPQSEAARVELILKRTGERVEEYLAGMFNISFKELYWRTFLKEDFTLKGKVKEHVFDNVVLRERRAGDGQEVYGVTVRRLRKVDGKKVKPSKQREELDKCGAPGSSYVDPLTFLLPAQRARWVFNYEGEDVWHGGRKVHRLGYLPRGEQKAGTRVEGDCVYAWGKYKGTVWIDAENFDVVQLTSRLVEEFDFESPRAISVGFARFGPRRKFRFLRSEYTMRFGRVRFSNPEQELLLPQFSESLNVIRGAREPRVSHKRSFFGYQRFVSDVKVIEEDGPDN